MSQTGYVVWHKENLNVVAGPFISNAVAVTESRRIANQSVEQRDKAPLTNLLSIETVTCNRLS